MVICLVTLMLIGTMAIAPNILTAGRREKEKEMIWRGKQYTRGVKLYYRKLGRFPTNLDDLTKPKIGSLRFMRQAYKDPMNNKDGSWRLIYVGPAGQLPQAGGGAGTPASALGTLGGLLGGQSQPGAAGQQPPGATTPGGATPGTNPTAATGTPVSADQGNPANPQAIPTGDTPTVVGGNIIGVGSKINKSSIIIYEKAKNYRLFEFIWDPSKDTIGAGQPGMQTGTGLGQVPGQNPIGQPIQNPGGQQPGQNPTNPPQNPPQQPQNPQQQQ
jgi:hypothetical protein